MNSKTIEIRKRLKRFRRHVEKTYVNCTFSKRADFGEILCHEIHEQPVNPRMQVKSTNNGFATGLTFKELAQKWGISVTFLGELIADHCEKLEERK